ncbi:MAG: hydroxyethylthiazole kinase [Deltaproteobacteria bacterium]|nr:hydroxyethylthiazole kinase [Deltaproteobacteria bacterium]
MINVTPDGIMASVRKIREMSPLIHNITNYVVMNTTANALLALGASPVMAHAKEEVRDMVSIARALVINLGTLSQPWVESAFMAAEEATARNVPVVIDPVGAGATPYRTKVFRDMILAFPPTVIRGNASEIMALSMESATTKGVDSTDPSHQAIEGASRLNKELGSVVCVSGEIDYVVHGADVATIRNGHPMMPRVTGLGCTASALCGAFAAVQPDAPRAVAEAMAVMGIAGEMAAEDAPGPGTLQVRFIDALHRLEYSHITKLLKVGGKS